MMETTINKLMIDRADTQRLATQIVAVIIGGIAVLSFNVAPVVTGVVAEQFQLVPSQLGLLVATEIGGITFASIMAVTWIRRINWRWAMAFSLLAYAAGNATCAFASGFTELLVLRGLIGFFGGGIAFTLCMSIFGDYKEPDRSFAMSIFGQIGCGVLGLLAFPEIAAHWGYSGIVITMALLSLLLLPLLIWIPVTGHKEIEVTSIVNSGHRGPIMLGLVVVIIWFFGLSSLWAFLERIGDDFGLAQSSLGRILAGGMFLGMTGALLATWAGDRWGRLWQTTLSIGLHIVLATALVVLNTPSVFIMLALLLTFIWNIGLPYLLGLLADSDVDGRFVVLIVAAEGLGNTLGPLSGGLVADYFGYLSVAFHCAAICVVALLMYLLFARRFRHYVEQSTQKR